MEANDALYASAAEASVGQLGLHVDANHVLFSSPIDQALGEAREWLSDRRSYSTNGRVRERQSLSEDLGSELAGRRERLRATTPALDYQLGLLKSRHAGPHGPGEAAAVAFDRAQRRSW